jgi:hypothetical protein
MGAAGRERVVAHYDWRQVARLTEAGYRGIVRAAARRAATVRAVAP